MPRRIATAGKDEAETFFLSGMTRAMQRLATGASGFPVTIYYAFKQSESDAARELEHRMGDVSGGSDSAGFAVTGTWPMRTELPVGCADRTPMPWLPASSSSAGSASDDAPTATRREFIAALEGRTAHRARPPPARQHRPRRPRPGRDRPRHGRLHPLLEGARRIRASR